MTVPVPRKVLVTGGSRGIGAAVVHAFADRGADVLFTYRADAAAADRVATGTAGSPGSASPVRHALGDDPTDLVDAVAARLGGLDALVLNAAQWRGGRLGDTSEAEWWSLVETNLRGSAQVVRATLDALTRSTAGSITFVGSIVGQIGFAGDTAYASSKAALVGLARSLAKELGGQGVRVNVVAPGFIETDMSSEVSPAARERILQRSVLRRPGTPADVAEAVAFMSEDAHFATGVVLPIDGGWSL